MWHYMSMASPNLLERLYATSDRLVTAGAAWLETLRRNKPPRVRSADEFRPGDLLRQIRAPMQNSAAYSWDLPRIMAARDQQMGGRFYDAVKLAAAMRTDDALAVAYENRLAPQRSLGVRLVAAPGARGLRVAAEGENAFGRNGASVTSETISALEGTLVNHGVAVGYNRWAARDDGSRLDLVHEVWPLEFCTVNQITRQLYTYCDPSFVPEGQPPAQRTPGGMMINIPWTPDGTWVVYRMIDNQPWNQSAALLSGALVWSRHAFAARDWSKGSASHGNAKIVGTLPAEWALQQTNPTTGAIELTPEAESYLALLQDIAALECPVGISQAGSTLQYLTNSSRAWEVWRELMLNAEKAAARIYLGTDGTLGSQGGAPGVDISELFGVATTRVQSSLAAITRGLQTGVIDPWAAVNFGDSSLAPLREYIIPDPDAQRVREEQQKNEAAFTAAIVARRQAGLDVTQEVVDELAERYGVVSAQLAAPTAPVSSQVPAALTRLSSTRSDRIPNIEQSGTGMCGPAALRSALLAFGIDRSEQDIARWAATTPADGTHAQDLADVATGLGIDAKVVEHGTVQQIAKAIAAGAVVLVAWFSTDEGHYSCVRSVSSQGVVLVDPETGADRTMPLDEFTRVWFDFDGATAEQQGLVSHAMIVLTAKEPALRAA